MFYPLLKLLSHDKHKRTNEEIANAQDLYTFNDRSSLTFISRLTPYVNFENKTVLDVGCGSGDLCITLADKGPKKIVGVDVDSDRIRAARLKAEEQGVSDTVSFECMNFEDNFHTDEPFDIVLSKASFEHIPRPLECLQKAFEVTAPTGVFAMVFGPLWFSPYGAHMWDFTPVPWVHFLFPEKTVLKVRRELFRPGEPATEYEDIRGHLNRISVRRFKLYATEAGFQFDPFVLNPAQTKGKYKLPNILINSVPVLRELGSFQALAVLRHPQRESAPNHMPR